MTKFEIVVNLKIADALRITIPQTLLRRANELIQFGLNVLAACHGYRR